MSRQLGLMVLAVVAFLLALALVLFDWGSAKNVTELTLGGFVLFAAAHLP